MPTWKLIIGLWILSLTVCISCKSKAEENTGESVPESKESVSSKTPDSIAHAAVYSSNDFGTTWQPIGTELPAQLQATDIEKVGHELVLATQNAGLFMTIDNKSSWKDISTGLATKKINTLYVNGDEIYIGLYHEGVTMWKLKSSYWNSFNNNLPNRNVRAIIKVGDELVIGTDMGIFKSNNHIQSWTGKQVGEQTISLVMSGDILYAGTVKGVMMSKDGGELWNYVHKGGAIHSLTIQDKKLYALYTSGDVFMSDNGARSWKEIQYSPRDHSPIYGLIKANDHFLMSNSHGVFQSTNGVRDWQLIFPVEKYWFVDFVVDEHVVYGASRRSP